MPGEIIFRTQTGFHVRYARCIQIVPSCLLPAHLHAWIKLDTVYISILHSQNHVENEILNSYTH